MIKTGVRLLAVVVSLLMLLTGPFAPLAAAQTPPAGQTEPAPPPATEQVPEHGTRSYRTGEAVAYNVGAVIANFFYIPGKCLLCGAGVASGVFVLLISVGSAPRTAAYFAREGCGGAWILTGDDLRPEADVRAFDWERDGTSKY